MISVALQLLVQQEVYDIKGTSRMNRDLLHAKSTDTSGQTLQYPDETSWIVSVTNVGALWTCFFAE